MNVKIHKPKDAIWRDASGTEVPVKFVPAPDKKKEALAGAVYKAAVTAEAVLLDLHKMLTNAFSEARAAVAQEYAIKGKEKKKGKGSFTWYNFDKSVKIEADINDIVKWDGAMMTEALSQLNSYISGNIGDSNELIKQLVNDAFTGSKGQIDSRKVFQLLKYENKIKDKRFLKACDIIKQASSVDSTKLYMRVSEKTETGEYRIINLNFSSI